MDIKSDRQKYSRVTPMVNRTNYINIVSNDALKPHAIFTFLHNSPPKRIM